MAGAVVQGVSTEVGTSVTSTQTNFMTGVVAGNTLYAIMGSAANQAITTPTSTPSETWTLVGNVLSATNPRTAVYKAENVTGGTYTITYNGNTSASWYLALAEVSGTTTTEVTGTQDDNTADKLFYIKGSGSLSQSGELILAEWTMQGGTVGTPTADGGFTLISGCTQTSNTFKGGHVVWKRVSTLDTPIAWATDTSPDTHTGVLWTVKESLSAGDVFPSSTYQITETLAFQGTPPAPPPPRRPWRIVTRRY